MEPGSGLYSLYTGSHHTGSGQVRSSGVACPSSLLACAAMHSLRQGLVARFPSLLVPPHHGSLPDPELPDVWGPSPVLGPRQERYFLMVVDEYSRYTTVFPLRQKADVPTVLEPWLLVWGGAQGLCGLRLHSNRGGEFTSTRQKTFCQGRGIVQSYTLPASPKRNGVAERRIGLVMEVSRTSMCHAGAPQFLWPQAVRYVAHQLNLWPSDAWPRVTPISIWTGANKLSPRTCACVFLGCPLDGAGWVFYDALTYEFFSSQDVTIDESVCFCKIRPHRGTEVFSPPLFLTPKPSPVAPVAPPLSRPAPHVTPQSCPPQRPVPVVSGGAGGAFVEGEGTGAAGAGGVGSGGARGVGVELPVRLAVPSSFFSSTGCCRAWGCSCRTRGPAGVGGASAGSGGVAHRERE
ncbi:unnamed protein product [Closterium sp. NIES-54]